MLPVHLYCRASQTNGRGLASKTYIVQKLMLNESELWLWIANRESQKYVHI